MQQPTCGGGVLMPFIVIAISVPLNSVRCFHHLDSLHEKFDLFLQLIPAVIRQDKAEVESLLERGANPNVEIQYSMCIIFICDMNVKQFRAR